MDIAGNLLELLVLYVTLAFIVEAVVETFVGKIPILQGDEVREWRVLALRWIAAGIAVAVAIGFDIRFLAALGLKPAADFARFIDYGLTGLLLGRGSSAVHDMMELKFLEKEDMRDVAKG